jgi:N,N'-diacetyllegionaminate synthase
VATITIADRKVGDGQPCFVIAEAGVAHNGRLDFALELVDAAAAAGADAVKFQTFRTQQVISRHAPKAEYQKRTTGAKESQFDMVKALELSAADHKKIVQRCRERRLMFLSTPFDEESVDLLSRLGVPAFKIASGDISNWPLLHAIASHGKPVILSTGMSWLGEVEAALEVLRKAGCQQVALLHCTSSYPAAPASVNLRAMATLAVAFQLPVGFSDHTLGIEIPLAAVALGASILEKHFTLDKSLPGPDHRMSLDPQELKALVACVRNVEASLGEGRKQPHDSELNVRTVGRRSIVAARDITRGTRITRKLLAFKRPGTGIPPSQLEAVLGRTCTRDLEADSILQYGDLK